MQNESDQNYGGPAAPGPRNETTTGTAPGPGSEMPTGIAPDGDTENAVSYTPQEERYVSLLLVRLSLQPNCAGFFYLREAILYAHSFSRTTLFRPPLIYKHLMRVFQNTADGIAQAMQRALDRQSVPSTKQEILKFLYGPELDLPASAANKARLQAMEFVAYASEAMRLDLRD